MIAARVMHEEKRTCAVSCSFLYKKTKTPASVCFCTPCLQAVFEECLWFLAL